MKSYFINFTHLLSPAVDRSTSLFSLQGPKFNSKLGGFHLPLLCEARRAEARSPKG